MRARDRGFISAVFKRDSTFYFVDMYLGISKEIRDKEQGSLYCNGNRTPK
jgi:hypothetical protein